MNILEELYKYTYKVYTRPYELNIVSYRTANRVANSFDDYIFVFYKDKDGRWITHTWQSTSDPGTKALRFPVNHLGTAILVAGQYVDAYQLGLHKGEYPAVVQVAPVRVYRDNNKDNVLNLNPLTINKGTFGINIHKAGLESAVVENWSSGCQVFKRSKDFDSFMVLAKKHAKLYGNSFTLTLLQE